MTVTVVVLDSVGVGQAPDANEYGDEGAHTLDHVVGRAGIRLPHLERLGLGHVPGVDSVPPVERPAGAFGRLRERSPGKDTTTGHWELMGAILEEPFRTFARFPPEVMNRFDAATGRGHLGNLAASGTEILDRLGEEHLASGEPIVYTSADSVFQVAAHVEVVPLSTLYLWCEAARQLLVGEHAVARVIARPFRGSPGAWERLSDARRDLSVAPPRTVLNALQDAGRPVIGIGKIGDIFAGQGVSEVRKTASDDDGVTRTVEAMRERPEGLVFTNLVDFDALYGHRRNLHGYAEALARFDARVPELTGALQGDDLLLFVSDHGNDPTWTGTDHTREHALLLAVGMASAGVALGTRDGFMDVGATVAEALSVPWDGEGRSFLAALRADL